MLVFRRARRFTPEDGTGHDCRPPVPSTDCPRRRDIDRRVPLVTPSPPGTTIDLVDQTRLRCVNKPAGMVVHPAAGHGSTRHLVTALRHEVAISAWSAARLDGSASPRSRTVRPEVVAKNDRAHIERRGSFTTAKSRRRSCVVWGGTAGKRIDCRSDATPDRKRCPQALRARSSVTRITPPAMEGSRPSSRCPRNRRHIRFACIGGEIPGGHPSPFLCRIRRIRRRCGGLRPVSLSIGRSCRWPPRYFTSADDSMEFSALPSRLQLCRSDPSGKL